MKKKRDSKSAIFQRFEIESCKEITTETLVRFCMMSIEIVKIIILINKKN